MVGIFAINTRENDMPIWNPDGENTEGRRNFPNVPDGVHPATIHKVTVATTKAGDLMFKLTLKPEASGYSFLFDNIVLFKSGKGIGITKHKLSCLGFDVSKPIEFSEKDLLGKKITVETRIYPDFKNEMMAQIVKWLKTEQNQPQEQQNHDNDDTPAETPAEANNDNLSQPVTDENGNDIPF